MAAVRAVEEAAVGRDLQVGAVARAGKSLGQRRDRLRSMRMPDLRVVIEHRDRVGQLVDDVDVLAVGMERQVPRPGAGGRADERLAVGGELAAGSIESIAQHLIESQVGRVGEAVVRADHDAMGVGPLLPRGVDARACVLHE